jgi:hypothetical protein
MSSLSMDPEKTKAAGVGTEATSENDTQPKNSGNESSAQCARLLAALKLGPLTTLAARRTLDVLHPAARIQTLRAHGHKILTIWTNDHTAEGYRHRVAKYVLVPGDAA